MEGEKKMNWIIGDTRVREEEEIGEIFPLQAEEVTIQAEEVTRIVQEPPVEPLSILVSQSWRRGEMEG